MWWFKKKEKSQSLESVESEISNQVEDKNIDIPKDKFILEDPVAKNITDLPIYAIYKRFQEDWESKGYHDATNFPETTYRDNQKRVIIDQLRIAIKEVLLRYDDKIVDIDIHISQAQKNGLMETYDKYIQEKRKLTAHRDELAALDKDAENIGEKTKPIIMSYEMGFTRGLVSLSNDKVSEIMNK